MDQTFHDKIARICIDHFNSLPKTGKPNKQEWTVLSCIVKENITLNKFEIVALGTGSKCIGKTLMSVKGDILNDSHAEIICRRAFLKYIYEQIDCNSDDIFISSFTLKNTIQFHFFTSHVPCGEAATFPDELGELVFDEPDCKRPKLEMLCTGAKRLSDSCIVRIKPGRGDPTLSVSCTDKIAKWCYLGIQGALLMVILKEPIYLRTFTIAGNTPFSINALSNALYRSFTPLKEPSIYSQHKMLMGQATIGFDFHKVDDKQPCPSSIIWSKTKRSLEVAVEGKKQGVTKKNQHSKSGRLQICKMELFRMFLNCEIKLSLGILPTVGDVKYVDAKMVAKDYQEAWEWLKLEMFKVWTVKDKKFVEFNID